MFVYMFIHAFTRKKKMNARRKMAFNILSIRYMYIKSIHSSVFFFFGLRTMPLYDSNQWVYFTNFGGHLLAAIYNSKRQMLISVILLIAFLFRSWTEPLMTTKFLKQIHDQMTLEQRSLFWILIFLIYFRIISAIKSKFEIIINQEKISSHQ